MTIEVWKSFFEPFVLICLNDSDFFWRIVGAFVFHLVCMIDRQVSDG